MYGCSKDCLIIIPFRLSQTAVSLSALNVSPLTQTIAPLWGSDPASVSPLAEGRVSPTNTPVFPPSSFVLPSFAVVLYILFLWSGTPGCSQLMFCMPFCVWRCVPDVSVERDVLLVHLLLCHLVLFRIFFFLVRWFICCKFIQLAEWNLNPPICTGHWKML